MIRRAPAADEELRAADAAARRLAVDEFERPVAIQAGAGTGKTRSLVARLATWLLGPGWEAAARELGEPATRSGSPLGRPFPGAPPGNDEIAARAVDGVVAITFTEAAAAEMADRLGRALFQMAATARADDLDPLPPRLESLDLAPRARAIAAVLSRTRIQTIHGFCHSLLAEHPFEAKLHPEFEIDADGTRLAAAAKESILARLRASDEALLALVADGIDPLRIHEALCTLVACGADPGELARPRFSDAVATAIVDRFAGSAGALLTRLDPLAAAVGARSKRTASAAESLDRLRAVAATTEGAAARLVRLAEAVSDERPEWEKAFELWRDGDLGKLEAKALDDTAADFLAAARTVAEALAELDALDPELYERARRALGPLVADTRRRLRRQGYLSYDDLLAEAARLLESSAWTRRRVRASIRQILVDEFQDTDRRQCRLLAALAFGGDAAATPDDARPGLFVVGDPKQSIYAWRSADLAAYERFLDEMRVNGGSEGRLAMNFRSAPPILAEVETSLAPAMIERPGVQPPFEPLFASERTARLAGFRAERRAPVEFWLSWDSEAISSRKTPTTARAAAFEAALIAADISELVRSGSARFGDFALLLRARGDLESYLDALRRAGVPYAVQKDRSYYRRREVIDAVSLLRLVLDPGDRLALVAALRSPFVGIPDAAWLPLFRLGLPELFESVTAPEPTALAALDEIVDRAVAETPRDVPGLAALSDWPLALRGALAAVAELREAFRAEPFARFLERLRTRFLLEPVAASRFLGRFGLANLRRLFGEIERRFAEASDPLAALAELRSAIEEEAEGEEARPPDAGLDAVSVLTIHTAKGLEFEQVFVPQLHRTAPTGARENEAERIGPERSTSGVAEHRLFGAPSPGWAEADREVATARDAETVRLLYVAMTRAKSRLVLLGRWERELRAVGSGGSAFTDRLAERRAADLETLFDPASEPELVDRGALWKRHLDPAPTPPREPAVATPATDLELVTNAARDAARRRSSRPRFATASALAVPPDEEPLDPESRFFSPGAKARGVGRESARARGIALHRALELAPLRRAAPEAWRERVVKLFRDEQGELTRQEIAALTADLDRLVATRSWRRLAELESAILARELPLVAPADRTDGPIGGHLGTLDLLYLDPDGGTTVVADFKSDPFAELPGGDLDGWIAERIERYRPQLELYGRAVRSALALPAPPRLELWLLAVDRIVAVPPAASSPASDLR